MAQINVEFTDLENLPGEFYKLLDAISDFNLPIWVSFVLVNSEKLLSREKLADAISTLNNYDVDCLLLNCSQLNRTKDAMNIVSENWGREWGIYPNLGIGEPSPDGVIEHIHSDQEFLDIINKAENLGADVLGGCCGAGVNHIELIAKHTL